MAACVAGFCVLSMVFGVAAGDSAKVQNPSGQWLVMEGQPQAEIILAPDATRSQRFAAGELQKYLERITGARLPIVQSATGKMPVKIYIGANAAPAELGLSDSDLEYDAFRIVSGDGWLAFVGDDADFVPVEPWGRSADPKEVERVTNEWDSLGGERWSVPGRSMYRDYSPALDLWQQDGKGSLNAIYHFLRSLGMRWFHPGELGLILPEVSSVAVPQGEVTVVPDFPMRAFWQWGCPYTSARPSNPFVMDAVLWELWLGVNHRQAVLGAGMAGHGGVAVHQRDVVKRENPEYFALWGGKRATDFHQYGAACLSWPELREEHLRYARFMFDNRGEPGVNLSPADGYTQICQCELCYDKVSPELGWRGQLSNYVWDYVNDLALQLYESHPDKLVTGIAYGMYMDPPSNIEQLSPNLAVGFCYWRSDFEDPAKRAAFIELRDRWQAITPSQLFYTWNYYLHGRPGSAYFGVPVYFPHAIAEDLQSLKGIGVGDYIEIYQSDGALATNHLNCYVNALYLWDADQDIEAILDEYCQLYMGPAASQMREFITYAEKNWPQANRDVSVINGIRERWEAVEAAAGDGVYGERAAWIASWLEKLWKKQAVLEKGRNDHIHLPVDDISGRLAYQQLDGKNDKPFWEGCEKFYLRTLRDGDEPENKTWVQARWLDGSLYLYVHAEESDMKNLRVGSDKDDDMNIFSGDVIEVLIETPVHAHYQLTFSPSGALVDLDRGDGLNNMWSSRAEVVAVRGEDYWALEIRLPAAGELVGDVDPLNGIAGDKPTAESPWHINICRMRYGVDNQRESSALSPTGGASFHDRWYFARLWVEE